MTAHPQLWLDAATFVSPAGRLALFAGTSCAGKTTLSAAITCMENWHALADDITLVDPNAAMVLPCRAPFRLRAGAFELLKSTLGRAPGVLIDDQWLDRPEAYISEPMPAPFDTVVVASLPSADTGFHIETLSPSEVISLLLPLSNALRLGNGIETLQNATASAECVKMVGGSLRERLDFFLLNERLLGLPAK